MLVHEAITTVMDPELLLWNDVAPLERNRSPLEPRVILLPNG